MTKCYAESAPYGINTKSENDMLFAFDTEEERDEWVRRNEFHRMPVDTDEPYAKDIDWRGVITWREWAEFNGIDE